MPIERSILAGGCFWGMQELIRALPGVTKTRVGYSGGELENPRYEDVSEGKSGHAEAIEVSFDPTVLSYRALLEFFFQIHDPTTKNRQGNDRGSQYRSAIFYASEAQKHDAEFLIREMELSKIWPGPIVTEIVPAGIFYEAEREHQDYLQHYPTGYTCHFVRSRWRLGE